MDDYRGLERIREIQRQLPFTLLDVEAAQDAFQDWKTAPTRKKLSVVFSWSYCYIYRYFIIKFAANPTFSDADFERIIAAAFRRVQSNFEAGTRIDRYPQWLSVVCKNLYRNFLRDHQPRITVNASEVDLEDEDAFAVDVWLDAPNVRRVVSEALERLPEYLREVTQDRFIRNLSYEEIGERHQKPTPLIRSYVHKALQKLRDDPNLQSLR